MTLVFKQSGVEKTIHSAAPGAIPRVGDTVLIDDPMSKKGGPMIPGMHGFVTAVKWNFVDGDPNDPLVVVTLAP